MIPDIEKFLFQEKTCLSILFIYDKEVTYISEVAANIDSTFAHTNKIIKKLDEIGFISTFFEGRTRFLQLTPKGWHYAKNLTQAHQVVLSDEIFEFPEGYVPTRKPDPEPEVSASAGAYAETGGADGTGFGGSERKKEKKVYVGPLTLEDRIEIFGDKIQEIYEEQTESDADSETLLRKLGPYDRELKMIGKEIEGLPDPDPKLVKSYRVAVMKYSFYLGKEYEK
ncbi:hypothetical protein MsAg5_14370 [Methanosarcinaceae archaeon Ag5]|uniref:Uncharacterized protein n=1 Tax=Methanolapillus africanus TaxID=3028297 RepID=A0AAE4MJB6_9EURY|nr:hypothetical protein [Methanosarcinaceae archaeon Ag5]